MQARPDPSTAPTAPAGPRAKPAPRAAATLAGAVAPLQPLLRPMLQPLLLALLTALWAAPSTAATVYQCGPGNFRETPCPGGQAREFTDDRNAEHREQAAEVARRERELSVILEKDRVQREKAAPPRGAAALTIPPEPTAAGHKARKAGKKKAKGKGRATGADAASAPAYTTPYQPGR